MGLNFGIVVIQEGKGSFGFPMPLESIDNLTATHTTEELMKRLKESNMIPNLDIVNASLVLGYVDNNRKKWIIDRKIPLITEKAFIDFSMKDMLEDKALSLGDYKEICSKLNWTFKNTNFSASFKSVINTLKFGNVDGVLDIYDSLSYFEQRTIKNEVYKVYEKKTNLTLKRTKTNIEVLAA